MHIFFFFNIVAFISTVDRDESVQQYLADLDNMHKERCKSMQQTRIYLDIQVVLEVPGEKELRAVAEKLSEAGIQVSQQFFKTITLLSLHHMSFRSTSCGWNNQKTSPRVWRPSPVRKRLNVWLVLLSTYLDPQEVQKYFKKFKLYKGPQFEREPIAGGQE